MENPIKKIDYNEKTQDMEILMSDGELIKAFFPTKRGAKKISISEGIKNEIIKLKSLGYSYDSIHQYVKQKGYRNDRGKPISRHVIIQTVKSVE